MPKIPTSGNQVRARGFRAPQVTSRAPVVGTTDTGRQLAQISNKAFQVAGREVERSKQFEVEEYTTKIRDAYRKSLWGDNENNTPGFLQTKGKNAMLKFEDSQKAFYDQVDSIIGEVGNEEIKERLNLQAAKFKSDFDHQLNSHTSVEREKHYVAQTQINIKSIKETAKAGYTSFLGSKSVVAENVGELNALVYGQVDGNGNQITPGFADRMGMSKKEADEYYLDQVSGLHYGVITQAMNNGQDRLAKDYYAAAIEKGEIDGDTRERLDKVVYESSLRGDSIRLAREAFGQAENLTQAREYIRNKIGSDSKDFDPELLDATIDRANRQWKEVEQARFEVNRQQMRDVTEKIREIGDDKNVPPEVKANLDKKFKKSLKKFINNYAASGADPDTNMQFYRDFKTRASMPDQRKKIMEFPLEYHIHELSKKHYDELLGIQNGLRAGTYKDSEGISTATENQIISKVAGELGFSKEKSDRFYLAVVEETNRWKKNNGKSEIPNDKLMQIADMMGTEVDVNWQFNDAKFFGLDVNDKMLSVDYGDIPMREKRRIHTFLRGKGKQATDSQIKQIYFMELQRFRATGQPPGAAIDSEFLSKL